MDDVVVIGAGVIGLTTGVHLAEAGAAVRIRTAGPPASTTSAAAGALIGPSFLEPADRVGAWSAVTLGVFTALARQPETGVRILRGTLVSRDGGPPTSPNATALLASPGATPLPAAPAAIPPQLTSLPEFRICPAEELPAGFRAGFQATLPVVDMPVYLEYLANRFVAAGGELDERPVGSLAEAATLAPVVVNCSGVAARDLAGDQGVRPVRGQHVIVANPGLDEFFGEGAGSPEFTAILPHAGHVVLGGVAEVDNWSREPDAATARRILDRCALVEPRLRGVRVIEHRVGLRPDRANGVRLELEQVGTAACIHCYGHGGNGVSLSWGCARDVAALAGGLRPSASPGTSAPTTRYT